MGKTVHQLNLGTPNLTDEIESQVAGGGASQRYSLGDALALATVDGVVVGPASATDGHVALFDGITGELIKDGGALGTAAFTSAADYATAAQGAKADSSLQAGATNVAPAVGSITGLGTGVAAALAIAIGSAGAPTLFDGALGTPSSITLTNATGLPVGGITGLGTGIATWLATPTSANLLAAITDETGSGALVFANTPTLVTPILGVATATSINKVAITAPATSATLTIADGKTLTVNQTLTLTGTTGTTMTFPGTSASVARTDAAQTFTGVQTFSSAPLMSTLTPGRVMFATTSGALSDSAALLWDNANSRLMVGTGTNASGYDVLLQKAVAGQVAIAISNTSNGASAYGGVAAVNDAGKNAVMWKTGSGYSTSGLVVANQTYMVSSAGTVLFGTATADDVIVVSGGTAAGNEIARFTTGAFAIKDAINVTTGTTTGTKIGGAANQKIGKWGVTPIVQPTGYGTPTNAANQGSFDATTITLPNLAAHVAKMVLDFKAAGNLAA